MDDLVNQLRSLINDDDTEMLAWDAANRIEALEAEVIRIGEVLDTVPSVALEWNSTDQRPPDFAERLLKAWGKIAIETLRNSEYQKLLRAKYAPIKESKNASA
jgi:hypothetical protein